MVTKEGKEKFYVPEVVDDYNKSVFPIQQASCIYAQTVLVIAQTRPAIDQAQQNPSMEGRGEHKISTVGEELLVIRKRQDIGRWTYCEDMRGVVE